MRWDDPSATDRLDVLVQVGKVGHSSPAHTAQRCVEAGLGLARYAYRLKCAAVNAKELPVICEKDNLDSQDALSKTLGDLPFLRDRGGASQLLNKPGSS